jgi:hypothetical protein
LLLGVPIVKPRLGGAVAADDPAISLPRVRKGFSFCHQLSFSIGWDAVGAVADDTVDGCTISGMLNIWPLTCSSGAQLRIDSRV